MFTAAGSQRAKRSIGGVTAIATALALAVPTVLGFGATAAAADEPDPGPDFSVLVFSKTAGFQHPAIGLAKTAIQQLGEDNNFDVTIDDDAARFSDEGLEAFDAVIFNSTTGDVLDDEQQAAFERYIQAGGGYVGVHSATDTEYDWPWYNQLVGAYFENHPAQQNATIKVEDSTHPSTAHLGDTWERFDEWYNYRSYDLDELHVLLTLDESTYTGGTDGYQHPIAWCHDFDGGRSWYTGLGHTDASYSEPAFLEHLLGGIETAAGATAASCGASQSASYELVTLDDATENPMQLDVAPDGTVFFAERDGRIRIIDPTTNVTTTALSLPVTTANEDGLLGIVLDPDFAENGWLYAYWSPSNVGGDGPHNRLSRFVYDAEAKTASLASEIDLLKVTTQRNTCCHAGGDMEFDSHGNLILVTGDNTNPFESGGYTPIDERAGKEDFDAQRSSANTNDLRGKVLRIHPEADGTYTIPEGNLFAPGTAQTRAEIYGMGFRNPFRIGIDPATDHIMVADYGPDAGAADPNRGPDGRVEWNLLKEPGNYGWPYCHAGTCYNDWNFATSQSGAVFSATNPVNTSPNNTGLQTLPPVIQPDIWYGYGGNPDFPEIGGGGAPMGGPVYRFDPDLDSDVKWPAYWDGKALFGEWNQGKMYSVQLDKETSTEIVDINRILPDIFDGGDTWSRPMDFTFGPDGALYIIDWGSGFGGNNDDSGVFKVNYTQGDPSPIARASADVTNGPGPLTVQFSSEGTRHPLAKDFTVQWTFGDGSDPSTDANPTHTYETNGEFNAQLVVTDVDGKTAVANLTIVVGNTAPTVTIDFPDNGGVFDFGDQVRYEVTVDDPDGEVDCTNVVLTPALGHDSHGHPTEVLEGCEGFFQTLRDDSHGPETNIFWIVEATYTDDGGEAGVPLSTTALQILQPKLVQSEYFSATGRVGGTGGADDGVRRETTADTAGGGQNIGYVEPNDWWAHDPVSLYNVSGITLRAASPNAGSTVSVRWGGPTGQELGQIEVPNTGAWQTYQDLPLTFDPDTKPVGSGGLYFVLLDGGINVNWMTFQGAGVTSNVRPDLQLTTSTLSGGAPFTVEAEAVASDPDGGEGAELTYLWDQGLGDGLQEGAASETFTYTEAGQYRLAVRVIDAGGAYNDRYVTVNVTPALTGLCLDGRSDGFGGDALDTERWTTVVRADGELAVEDGALVIPASKTDIYGAGAGTVTNIVLQDLPAGAWQATAKVTLPADRQYQQAGLVVYGDDDNYAKMVLQGRAGGSSPNTNERIFQFIREEAGQANEVAASNTANLGSAFPETYFVRLASNGTNLTAAYSADGVDYTSMSETKQLAGIQNPKIGLIAFANQGATGDVIDARFDWFHLTPDDTVSTGPDDEFDGDELNACRWGVLREVPDQVRVADGWLEIDTSDLDIYGGDQGATGFVLQDQPGDGDWIVETKVDGSAFAQRYQQGGLILHTDDDNYVKLDIVATNQAGGSIARNLEMRSEIGGSVQDPQPNADEPEDGIVWLRLGKSGTTVTGWYSADGEQWTQIQQFTNVPASAGRVGLYTLGTSNQTEPATGRFDYFRVIEGGPEEPGEPLEVSASVDPTEPTGSGWYAGPVTVTVETTGGTGDIYREVKVDDGGWQEYTTPVIVTAQGAHTVSYRASGGGDDTEVGEVSFKIDSEAPVSSATVDPDARTVTLRGADAGSGLERIEVAEGDDWVGYDEPIEVGDDGAEIRFRAVDKAGNVETANTVEVPGVEEETVVTSTAAVVAGSYRYGVDQRVTVRVTAADGSVPTGRVQVLAGAKVLGSGAVKDGRASVRINGEGVLPGTHQLEVRYVPTAAFTGSTDVVKVKVHKAVSTLTAKLSRTKVSTAARAKLTVQVRSTSSVIAGTVTVRDGKKVLRSGVTLKNGKATITLPKLSRGTHRLTVVYSGSARVEADATKVTLRVVRR